MEGTVAASTQVSNARAPQETGERRHVTVMFVDLVGSTALSGRLDPEELGELIRAFQAAASGEVVRHEGYVARYMGDGLLVYFGWPRAHEDHAERAARAGLDVIRVVQKLEQATQTAVRVGVATGHVVVGELIGEGASGEAAIVGETPNLAARLQGLAMPDTVLVSASTRRLLGQGFEMEDLGQHALKGFSEPVPVWRVVCEHAVATRFLARAERSVAPLAGRVNELALLVERWEEARTGQGQVVTLAGEAGVGKSRLLLALDERTDPTVARVRLQCSAHLLGTSLHPMVEHVARSAMFQGEDGVSVRVHKLGQLAASWGLTRDTDLGALCSLMNLEGPDVPMLTGDARSRKLEVLEMSCRALLGREGVVVVEDVQWADATTMELLHLVVEKARGCPVLVVITHRPELVPPWLGRGHVSALGLVRLKPAEARQLARSLGGTVLDASVIDDIVARAGGVPSFVEELARAVAAGRGAGVPDSIQDSLMAQLDRLPDARLVAQTAAVLGTQFRKDLLLHVYQGDPAALERGLGALVQGGLVHASGLDDRAPYAFRHGLLRDVAYESLLHRTQRILHGRVADTLVERFADEASASPEVVARHLADARRTDEAAAWWQKAVDHAKRRGGTLEAVAHLEHLVGLLESEGNDADVEAATEIATWRIELALQYRNMGRTEAAFESLDRAMALGERHQLLELLSHAHYARGNVCFLSFDVPGVRKAHEKALDYARRAKSKTAEIRALGGLADAAMAAGDMESVKEFVVPCIEQAEAAGLETIVVANLPLLAWALAWNLELDEARRVGERAVQRANQAQAPRGSVVAHEALLYVAIQQLDTPRLEALLEKWRPLARGVWGPASEGMVEMYDAMVALFHDDPVTALGHAVRGRQVTAPTDPMGIAAVTMAVQARCLEGAERTQVIDELERLTEKTSTGYMTWACMVLLETACVAEEWDRVERAARTLALGIVRGRTGYADHVLALAEARVAWERGHGDLPRMRALHDKSLAKGARILLMWTKDIVEAAVPA